MRDVRISCTVAALAAEVNYAMMGANNIRPPGVGTPGFGFGGWCGKMVGIH